MEKFAVPIALIVGVFLYFTHDAGFQFERASAEKRHAFVERQANLVARKAEFPLYHDSKLQSLVITEDAMRATMRIRVETTMRIEGRRTAINLKACEGYLKSFLDEHDITLRLEFYRGPGTMAAMMTLTPISCKRMVEVAQKK
jgi:hypothetical protein